MLTLIVMIASSAITTNQGPRPCIANYLTHYCIVRADIPFGAQAAQLIHAAGQSISEPVSEGTYAIALHVKCEADLRALSERLTTAAIEHALIVESDPPFAGQAMAIGVKPTDRKQLKPFLSSYALVAQPDRAAGVMTRQAGGLNPPERSTHAPLAQPDRASRVMTSKVGGLNPSGCATSPSGLFQRIRRWLGGRNSQTAPSR